MNYKNHLSAILAKIDELEYDITELACKAHSDFLKTTNDSDMNRCIDLFEELCKCDEPLAKITEIITKYQEKYEQ